MLFRFIGCVCVCAGLAMTGYNDVMKPENRAAALRGSFLNSTLETAGVPRKPNATELLLTSQVIGAFLLGGCALVCMNVLRRIAALLLALFVIVHFVVMHVDIRKPITGIPRGHESVFFADLALVGALLVICTLRDSRRSSRKAVAPSPTRKSK